MFDETKRKLGRTCSDSLSHGSRVKYWLPINAQSIEPTINKRRLDWNWNFISPVSSLEVNLNSFRKLFCLALSSFEIRDLTYEIPTTLLEEFGSSAYSACYEVIPSMQTFEYFRERSRVSYACTCCMTKWLIYARISIVIKRQDEESLWRGDYGRDSGRRQHCHRQSEELITQLAHRDHRWVSHVLPFYGVSRKSIIIEYHWHVSLTMSLSLASLIRFLTEQTVQINCCMLRIIDTYNEPIK